MKHKTLLIIICSVELALCLLFVIQAIRFWLYPFLWGWPSEIHQQSVILLAFALSMLAGALALAWVSGFGILTKVTGLLVLIFVTFTVGSFLVLYVPIPHPAENVMQGSNINQAIYSQLAPCGKIEAFVDIGYRQLDMDHSVVMVPDWMEQPFKEIPQDVLVNCMARTGNLQLSLMRGSFVEDEIPIRKIHALLFEAIILGVEDAPPILNLFNVIVCQKKYDLVGHLTLQYYLAKYHAPPSFETYSIAGANRLEAEACAP